ncbi:MULTISPECIES: hemerythrin domain-containing protein [unclassified Methylophaga]|jgi:hemerythrin|uniref:bacteriohemerythrin n=1 Tax=unclassified Methylophaga TaxID=2629249 RepID=UPI000C0E04BB|nr:MULTISPECIES: hemerythrin domain-containing protein [unclassified Methylophaga]MBL1458651.1 chemotaxis protein [Methylophaga sp.]|tara:strand:+ start:42 stop:473 length:432 start_codon:yes stop_codon:yes gene_type:complete
MERIQQPLYIVWQDKFVQDEPIIDEQHRGAIAIINSLHYFIQQGYGLKDLMPTVNVLKSYLNFHFKTEQGILHAMESPLLQQYRDEANKIIDEFDIQCRLGLREDDAQVLLVFLKDWWKTHLKLHKKITPYLHKWEGDYCRTN